MRSVCSQFAALFALAGTALLGVNLQGWLAEQGMLVPRRAQDAAGHDSLTLLIGGREKRIRLDRLTEEDQAYLKTLSERLTGQMEEANFSDAWPTCTSMEDKLEAKAMLEDEATGLFIYETSHFRFYSPVRLGLATVSEMGRVFEGTLTACRAMPLNFPCRRINAPSDNLRPPGELGTESQTSAPDKMEARLFATRQDYALEVGAEHAQTAGLFREPEILVPFESLGLEEGDGGYTIVARGKLAPGTLIHELTHQMSLPALRYDIPIWFAEGIAEYMRLATYRRGDFDFRGVRKNLIPYLVGGPGTTSRQLGRHLSAPPLKEMLNMSFREFQSAQGGRTQFNYGFSALLTYYFIHLDGEGDGARLKHWMRHLQGTERVTAGLSMKIPADSSPAEIEAARHQLKLRAENMREEYYYAPLLDGRSWQELEAEFSRKVKAELGISVQFN